MKKAAPHSTDYFQDVYDKIVYELVKFLHKKNFLLIGYLFYIIFKFVFPVKSGIEPVSKFPSSHLQPKNEKSFMYYREPKIIKQKARIT